MVFWDIDRSKVSYFKKSHSKFNICPFISQIILSYALKLPSHTKLASIKNISCLIQNQIANKQSFEDLFKGYQTVVHLSLLIILDSKKYDRSRLGEIDLTLRTSPIG